MNIFKHQVTDPETDCSLMFATSAVSLIIAAIPPYGLRTTTFVVLALGNGFNGWGLRRKIAAAKNSGVRSNVDENVT